MAGVKNKTWYITNVSMDRLTTYLSDTHPVYFDTYAGFFCLVIKFYIYLTR
jgi:hypothetical protein